LVSLEFELDAATRADLTSGRDFIQLKSGPFLLDIIHAPDGIESFEKARSRRILVDGLFPVASLQDIIASKRAAFRDKDRVDLALLEEFALEYQKAHPKPLASSAERAAQRSDSPP
jgi:hypothetical protein